jgi:hypothetical protein
MPTAHADEAGARQALDRALQRATMEAQTSPRLSFTETVAEKGVTVSARFDPCRSPAQAWTPLQPALSAQEKATYRGIVHDTPDERDLLLARIPDTIAKPGTLVRESNGVATFDFALSPSARPTNSPLDAALSLAKHIRFELSVDESSQTLTGFRFYAPSVFAATPLAHVDHVDMRFDLGLSYADGPTIVRRIDTDAAYNVVGVAAKIVDTVWFKDVLPAPASECPRSRGP